MRVSGRTGIIISDILLALGVAAFMLSLLLAFKSSMSVHAISAMMGIEGIALIAYSAVVQSKSRGQNPKSSQDPDDDI